MSSSSCKVTVAQGTAIGITSCVIWSCAILVMSLLSTAFGAMRAAGIELLIAGMFLLAAAAARGDLRKIFLHSRPCLILCGVFWILNNVLSWVAVSTVTSSAELLVVGLLNYLWPSCTLLLAIPLLGKRPTRWLPVGLLVVFFGIALAKISTSPNAEFSDLARSINVIAYACAVLDALAWGIYSNLSAKLSHPEGASGVPVYMVAASLLLLCASQVLEPPASPTTNDWCLLVGWALASGLAYVSWDVGMRKGSVVTISVASMLIPLSSTIITAFMSGYGMTLYLLVAAALVVAGSAVCRRSVV